MIASQKKHIHTQQQLKCFDYLKWEINSSKILKNRGINSIIEWNWLSQNHLMISSFALNFAISCFFVFINYRILLFALSQILSLNSTSHFQKINLSYHQKHLSWAQLRFLSFISSFCFIFQYFLYLCLIVIIWLLHNNYK